MCVSVFIEGLIVCQMCVLVVVGGIKCISHVSQMLLEALSVCLMCVSVGVDRLVRRLMCMSDVCLSCCWKSYMYVRCVCIVVGRVTCMSDVCLSYCWKSYMYVRCVSQLLLE